MRIVLEFDNEQELIKNVESGVPCTVEIPDKEAHHAKNVMRLKEGAYLEIISKSSGKIYRAVIQEAKKSLRAELIGFKVTETKTSFMRALLFANCKGGTNELVLEKCCELGVREVIIWQARHSVAKIETAADEKKKLARWQKICDEAAKQSGNSRIPKVFYYRDLKSALASESASCEHRIACALIGKPKELREILTYAGDVCAVVGPEGDFNGEEYRLLEESGFSAVTLGPHTLRAETAALSVISGVNAILGYK